MNTHTPIKLNFETKEQRDFSAGLIGDRSEWVDIRDSNNKTIGAIYGFSEYENEKYARLICRSVNSHDDLLRVLIKAEFEDRTSGISKQTRREMRDLIAKATQEGE